MIIENQYYNIIINSLFPYYSRQIYRINNQDLQHLNDIELDLHYINHGFNEGRICNIIKNKNFNINNFYPNYSRKLYKINNEDLQHLNDIDLDIHYVMYGYNEHRICN